MPIQATRCFNDSAFELNTKAPKADPVDEAVQHFDQGQYQTALEKFDAILREDPHHLGALIGKSESLARLNEPEKALESARIAIDQEPRNPILQSMCADRLVAMADSAFRRLAPTGDRQAALEARHKHLEEAIKRYDIALNDLALDTEPHRPDILMKQTDTLTAMGFNRMGMRDYQGAKGAFDQVLALQPDHADAERGKRRALTLLGEPRESPFCNGALL